MSTQINSRLTAQGARKFNLILATDVYKFSHSFAYPENVVGMYSYQEARTKTDVIVPFGMQMVLTKTLANPITMEDIQVAEDFCRKNGALFAREKWEYIVNEYDGYLPVKIRTVPEGTPVRSGNVLVTVECVDPEVFWIASYIETFLLRGIWYPTTIATIGREMKEQFANFYEVSGANKDMLVWAMNDFGARGVTCAEQAEIGGAAHMVNFQGSDTVEGIEAANLYYDCEMASTFAVPATEHSVECSFGLDEEGEEEYLRHTITHLGRPGGLVSIVIDGKDVYRATRKLCSPEFVQLIKDSGAKIVFRPDSGDMMEIVPWILKQQEEAFGFTLNAKGYKVINNVGVIQGDGIDKLSAFSLMGKIVSMGYSADVFVMGSGGGLLQKVNRDTFKFAQKASAILVKDYFDLSWGDAHQLVWIPISKDPVTDHGKKSKAGRVSLARKIGETGPDSFVSYDMADGVPDGYVDALVTVYDKGVLMYRITLDEVRKNAAV